MASTKAKKEKRKRASARRKAQMGGSFERTTYRLPEGMKQYKAKAGIAKIDIIETPAGADGEFAKKGELWYEQTFWTHPRIGPNEDAYICPAKTFKKKCPVCEHRAKLNRDPDADEKLVDSLKPKQRQLFYVRDNKEPEEIQLYESSYHNFGKRLDAEINSEGEDNEDIDAFASVDDDGLTLKVGFADDSFAGTSFVKAETISFKPRTIPIDPELVEKLEPLSDLLIIKSYDELKKIYNQEDAGEDDEEEDDEDIESEEEEEDDEDEKPAKKSSKKSSTSTKKTGKKSSKPSDDDEDEDEEEDDDADLAKIKKKYFKKRVQFEKGGKTRTGFVNDLDEDGEIAYVLDLKTFNVENLEIDELEVMKDQTGVEKGDKVEFFYKGSRHKGTVKKVDSENKLLHVSCKDRSEPHIVNINEVVVQKEEEEDEEEDVKPSKKGKEEKPKSKPKPKDEDDDDEEEEEEEDEEEEDEDDDPPPKKKSKEKEKKGKKKPKDEDEEEDDDDIPFDDDEEDDD